ncbi:exonuclease, DNA polymerase III, epsilon subunit family protein [Fulvimarina pelagi HTCC2506]|uniref:DNA-directed DNA polymerase n=1 Tax=Fulvimarina pelagi HTCC2506 TaxID=314231 RepID=Q0FXM2_9HYPH|nr:3'-5' exonuclease [Fulvimarina pelagi]EAU39714.1 exonuclease, DNA polymerase III, epsilon subunit family protein [Fulvimarina pelagi HTCC2506]
MKAVSVRLRVFLLFSALAVACVAAVGVAFGSGVYRGVVPIDSVVGPLIIAGFLLLGLVMSAWFAFDKYIARPIDRLAAEMRVRAHCNTSHEIDLAETHYLGDLAHAADAVTRRLGEATFETAGTVARETARLEVERQRLTACLTEIPVATIVVSATDKIVLYDGQAAEILAQTATPRLNAPISDYFEESALGRAKQALANDGNEIAFDLSDIGQSITHSAVMRSFADGGYLLAFQTANIRLAPDAARPLVYDFSLLDREPPPSLIDCPLRDLVYCVFDTETTGLIPHRDEIVQIGAIRIVDGKLVEGETFDTLVDPGGPIPRASSKIHGITDKMVMGQPRIAEAGRRFFEFSKESVLVAHNAPFDMSFLRRHEKAMGVAFDHPIVDTVLVSAIIFGTTERHMLDVVCERLGIRIEKKDRHTALGDARVTAEAMKRMLPLLEARGIKTFGKLIAETRKRGRLVADLN